MNAYPLTVIEPDELDLRTAAIAAGHLELYDKWQAERNALLAERTAMEARWAAEDAAWIAQRNRLAVATIVDAILLVLTMLALLTGLAWLATLLLIACVPGVVVALGAIIWPSGIYPWSRITHQDRRLR